MKRILKRELSQKTTKCFRWGQSPLSPLPSPLTFFLKKISLQEANQTLHKKTIVFVIIEIIGNWEHWSSWSSCSVTCGIGSRNRYRFCKLGDQCQVNHNKTVKYTFTMSSTNKQTCVFHFNQKLCSLFN